MLPDSVLEHLRNVIEAPDLDGTKYEVIEELGRGGNLQSPSSRGG